MRNTFIDALLEAARDDANIFLIVGDLGYSVVDKFSQELPHQFLNAGVAEQNMIGMAAGLAKEGYKVFVYSIANFPVHRCLEQIRLDVCYHNLDVTVVSVGAGFGYGTLGYSHHAVEDLGVMRGLPNMRIYSPSDPFEALACLNDALHYSSPKYVRLGKNGEINLHSQMPSDIDFPIPLSPGGSTLILTTGSIAREALVAQELLKLKNIDVAVFTVPLVSPLNFVTGFFDSFKTIFVVEEHSLINGLGSAVSDMLHEQQIKCRLIKIALKNSIQIQIGSQEFLRKISGLDGESIAHRVKSELGF